MLYLLYNNPPGVVLVVGGLGFGSGCTRIRDRRSEEEEGAGLSIG